MNNEKDKRFDRKTFFATSMFFLVILVNPRDFPVPNIPLIYPAFLFFLIIMGPNRIFSGFRSTRFLCILSISYWFYVAFISIFIGGSVGFHKLPYLIEPVLILIVAGIATTKPGGTKAALWALISMIGISTAAGLWIYFIGEPLLSLKSAIFFVEGQKLFKGNAIEAQHAIDYFIKRNAGLTYYVFHFSYQLAAGIIITVVFLFFNKNLLTLKTICLYGLLMTLVLGAITNSERVTILSASIGILSYFLIGKAKIDIRKFIIYACCILIILGAIQFTRTLEDKYTLHARNFTLGEEFRIRFVIIPMAALKSVFYEPLGSGFDRLSNHFADVSSRFDWNTGPHNHFLNLCMHAGMIGVFFVFLFLGGMWKQIQYVRSKRLKNEGIALAVACITLVCHSLTHNTGFFSLEPTTLTVFGLLWGSNRLLSKTEDARHPL